MPTTDPQLPALVERGIDRAAELFGKLIESHNHWRDRAELAERELAELRERLRKLAGV